MYCVLDGTGKRIGGEDGAPCESMHEDISFVSESTAVYLVCLLQ
jgi:hypothetical protein